MKTPHLSVGRTATWMPSFVVIGTLAGLGHWGHASQWTIPTFSSLVADTPPAGAASPPDGPPAATAFQVSGDVIRLNSPQAVQRCGITLGAAQVGPLREFVTAHGVVNYNRNRTAEIASPVAGTVWRVERKVGEIVRRGEVLALISSVAVGNAKTEFLRTVLDLSLKRTQLERLQSAGGAVAVCRVVEAEAEARQARFRLLQAQQALINLGLPIAYDPDETVSDEELIARVHFLGIPEAVSADFDRAAMTTNLLPLKAPFDGVIIRRECALGEVVEPATAQFVVADVSRMWVELDVSEENAAQLEIGQTVLFTAQVLPGELECRLTWIGTDVDERTRTVRARAEIDNPRVGPEIPGRDGHRRLKANVFGIGRICIRNAPAALMLPRAAVQWDGQSHVVFRAIADGLSFEPVTVQTGTACEGRVEIIAGLAPQDQIVVAGSHILKSELVRRQEDGVL